MHRALWVPGAFAWRWFTGKPLDGVPRTDVACRQGRDQLVVVHHLVY